MGLQDQTNAIIATIVRVAKRDAEINLERVLAQALVEADDVRTEALTEGVWTRDLRSHPPLQRVIARAEGELLV